MDLSAGAIFALGSDGLLMLWRILASGNFETRAVECKIESGIKSPLCVFFANIVLDWSSHIENVHKTGCPKGLEKQINNSLMQEMPDKKTAVVYREWPRLLSPNEKTIVYT
jgi:hypothetical protein